MALITYEDKSNSLPITNVRRIYRDIDANEVKDVVNENAEQLQTREFNRDFDIELLFDKNEIDYAPIELTGDVTYTVAGSGNLSNKFCVAIQTLITDGTHALFFSGIDYIYGIQNGATPEAGTYQIFFMYRNGVTTANWAAPSSQVGTAVQLSAPGSFAAMADGQTAIDLSWSDVSNESSYLIEWSTTGTGGWATLSTPAAGSTSDTQTGLSANTTRFYRIKAVGDGVNFLDSAYSTASATTEDAGDVTAPTFTWYPLTGTSAHRVNENIIITANEAIRNDDGSAITNANVASVITLKQTNSGGANIAFTATIDVSKTIITILPNPSLGQSQLVYVAVHDVEDVNGNEIASPISITFTTTTYALFNGTSNRVTFGDILDSVFGAVDTNFWLELTIKDPVLSGTKTLVTKFENASLNQCFYFIYSGTDVYFVYYFPFLFSGAPTFRGIKWTGALSAGVSTLVLKYDGSIDTNDGLDRGILLVNGGTAGSKTAVPSNGSLIDYLQNSASHLSVGIATNSSGVPSSSSYYAGEGKDFIVRSANGSVVEINIPDLAAGLDTSGNARHGTWV